MSQHSKMEGYYYLSKEAREKLPHYQYKGADHSLTYHYVLSPLAAWCVETLVPTSVAPNSITFFGLLWMITAYLAYWYYVPDLDTISHQPPRWIFLWNGISMLAYQTLDNMDGKQARRTKSSSPLGLLFDHGCDAINSIFGSANWIIGMALLPSQNLLQCWSLVFGPFALFYISTWEEYYTGELILPLFNGPNEGLLGGAMLSFASWWYGPEMWQETDWFQTIQAMLSLPDLPFTVRNCDFVITVACVGFVQEALIKSIQVTRKYQGAAETLLPLIAHVGSFLLVGYVNPEVLLSSPRTTLHLASILFVEMSTEIMLVHVTAQPFHPWRQWQLIPLLLLAGYMAMGGEHSETVEYAISAYTWSIGSYLLFKLVLTIHELCTTLGIWCFDILTPHPNKKKQN